MMISPVYPTTVALFQHLDLRECDKITNEGLVHLAKLSSLQHLNLQMCNKITNESLQLLVNMPSLDPEQVHATYETKVTEAGFEAFKKQLLDNQRRN